MGDEPTEATVQNPPEHGSIRLLLRGVVLDIGLAGLALETGTRLTPQRPMGLRLNTPDGALTLKGRVVWCFFHGTTTADGGEQVPVYRAGIEFYDVLTPIAEQLLEFLDAHAQVTGETRMFGRFRVANAGPVSVHSESRLSIVAVDAESGTVTVEAELGLEPAPGCESRLRLDSGDLELTATVADTERVPSSGRWRLHLALENATATVLGRLRDAAGL